MKNFNISIVFVVLILCFGAGDLFAQKKRKKRKKKKINVEQTLCECPDTPVEDRARIAVARFEVPNPEANRQIGYELGAMLMNALNATNCFHVLESGLHLDDALYEISLAESGVTNQEVAPDFGQMYGAQLLITGEVTEYEDDFVNVLGFGIDKVHVGFILKIIDPQTRTVVWSQSVERKFSKPIPKIAGTPVAIFSSKAMEDAVEYAILESVELITQETELLEKYNEKNTRDGGSNYSLAIQSIDFEQLLVLEKELAAIPGVQLLGKTYRDEEGTLRLHYNQSINELVTLLVENPNFNFKIIEFDYQQLTLAMR